MYNKNFKYAMSNFFIFMIEFYINLLEPKKDTITYTKKDTKKPHKKDTKLDELDGEYILI